MPLLDVALAISAALSSAGQASAPARSAQSAPTPAPADPSAAYREPEAIAALERMGAYLRGLKSFSLTGDTTYEEVLENGQKLQYAGKLEIMAQPPTKLRVNILSDRKQRAIYYDGKAVTVFAPRVGYYATVDAPGTIGDTIRRVDERYGLEIPLADLFTMGSDPEMTQRIDAAFRVGTETLGSRSCDHYAFRQENVDWQLWIEEGERPLPCKMVITDTSDPAQPEYQTLLTWDINKGLPADIFNFTPGNDAQRIVLGTVEPSES